MAEIALGANCAACGSLVAASGKKSDKQLVGTCPVCKVAIFKDNPEYAKSPFEDAYDELKLKYAAVVAENTTLRAEKTAAASAVKPAAPPGVSTRAGNS